MSDRSIEAQVIDLFDDYDNAGEVLRILMTVVGTVLSVASRDRADALNTAALLAADLRGELTLNYEANRKLWDDGADDALAGAEVAGHG